MEKQKVLAALRPEAVVSVERALGQYVEVVPVHSFEEATRVLAVTVDFDLVLCGIYFGQTRMFDFMRLLREQHAHLPFIACRVGDTEIPQVTLEAIGIAATTIGAAAFVNFPLLRSADSDAEFRAVVLSHLKRRTLP